MFPVSKTVLSSVIALILGIPLGNVLSDWFVSSNFTQDNVILSLVGLVFYITSIGAVFCVVRAALH